MLDKLIQTYTIPDFAAKKYEVLQRIFSAGTHSAIDTGQKVSNTDWYLPPSRPRTYIDPISCDIECAIKQLCQTAYVGMTDCGLKTNVINYWFQQYESGDYHDWHIHDVMYAVVVFIELAPGAETRFMVQGVEHRVPVEEGQILVFPGVLPHCSPPNNTGKRKTSIALNVSIL